MPQAVRKGDICTGHSCYPPRPNAQGSPDVFINGRPAHRMGDAWKAHCCGKCHTSVTAQGSPNVFVNGKPKVRIGDRVACGSACATGSFNVFVNG